MSSQHASLSTLKGNRPNSAGTGLNTGIAATRGGSNRGSIARPPLTKIGLNTGLAGRRGEKARPPLAKIGLNTGLAGRRGVEQGVGFRRNGRPLGTRVRKEQRRRPRGRRRGPPAPLGGRGEQSNPSRQHDSLSTPKGNRPPAPKTGLNTGIVPLEGGRRGVDNPTPLGEDRLEHWLHRAQGGRARGRVRTQRDPPETHTRDGRGGRSVSIGAATRPPLGEGRSPRTRTRRAGVPRRFTRLPGACPSALVFPHHDAGLCCGGDGRSVRRHHRRGSVAHARLALLLDEVLNLEELWFGRELDPHVAEDGHQLLTVSLERLARTPYLAGT